VLVLDSVPLLVSVPLPVSLVEPVSLPVLDSVVSFEVVSFEVVSADELLSLPFSLPVLDSPLVLSVAATSSPDPSSAGQPARGSRAALANSAAGPRDTRWISSRMSIPRPRW
jgi:hypothetical protein